MTEVPLYGLRVCTFHATTCRFYRGGRVSLGDEEEVERLWENLADFIRKLFMNQRKIPGRDMSPVH